MTKAYDKKQEDLLWQRWMTVYPYMELGKLPFLAFPDYKEKLAPKNQKTTDITPEEIIDELSNVVSMYRSLKGR